MPRQIHIVWGFMGRLMASMKTRHPLKDTHWVGVMTVPQWFGENSKQCGSVRERDGWGLWIKLEEDDTWRVLVVAGGGLAIKQLRDGKAQEEAICEHTVWYLNGSGETRGNQLQAKDSVKSYRKWFKTTETWRGLRVGLLFSSKQPLNLWCPVHRDYETIHRQVKEVMLVFYI